MCMRWTVNLSPKKRTELCLDQALNLKSPISYKAALNKNTDVTGIQTVEWGEKIAETGESANFPLVFR